MKRSIFLLALFLLFMNSCEEEESIPASGTVTIDNTLAYNAVSQAYYAFGFLFSKAEKVSTLSSPKPDITVDSDGASLFFQTNNFRNSFYRTGEYADQTSAVKAFKELTEVNVDQWLEWASPLKPNQVWIYRSGAGHYAKIRIISTVSEVRDNRDYAECTVEWVYQPDGSLTFPGK